MRIRTLSLIALVLCTVLAVMYLSVDAEPLPGPSPEMREFFKYAIGAILVAFVAYLAMTRR